MKLFHNGKPVDKVVFVGNLGVGKTVALNNLSDVPVINTDVKSREARMADMDSAKTTTTVGFDYGEWTISSNKKAYLFGMPSQARFSAIWDFIIPDSSAIVIWAFGNQETGVEDCRKWLELLKSHKVANRMCLAVTRILPNDDETLDQFRDLVAEYHPFVPVITADPREKASVIQAVMVALSTPYLKE